ncbi:MAG: hypothetical protein WCR36_08985 [Bacteroidaceae bacterium]
MELKKYFHNKLINFALSSILGAVIVGLIIRTQTDEMIVISTYAFLFILFTVFFQLLKSTIRKYRLEKYKLCKEWFLFCFITLLSVGFAIIGYYNQILFYKVIAWILCAVFAGLSYVIYRFVYLTAIFKNKLMKQEVLYFSWKMWGEMLDDGEEEETIADLLVSAQTKCNYRFVNNTWGARFSNVKVYDDSTGESESASDDVVVPVVITEQLKKNALATVKTYEVKKKGINK